MWPCRKGAGMCPVASMALKALVKCKMSEGPPRCPVRQVCLVLEQKRLQNLIAACNPLFHQLTCLPVFVCSHCIKAALIFVQKRDSLYALLLPLLLLFSESKPPSAGAASPVTIYCKLGRSCGIISMLKSLQKHLQRRHKQLCLKIDTLLRRLMYF